MVNSKSLIEACRSGDIKSVGQLLKKITLVEINKADWTTGNTPLHLATCYDHIDIVRVLLLHGAMRNILNYEKKIPADYASTIEMRKLFERVNNNNNNSSRFVNNDSNEEDNKEIEWLQNSLDATQFYMEYESGMSYSGQWDINQTVDALRKVSELGNMYDMNVVWNFFEQASDKTDAKYLIRAYTLESKFYKILNHKLIKRRSTKSIDRTESDQMQNTMIMFNQGFALAQTLMTAQVQTDNSNITDWVHRYMGTIHSLISQPIFPFTGLTYRGMWIKKEKILYYSENRSYMCNKTLTSTSKNYKIAKRSMEEIKSLPGQIAVMCTYLIDSYTSFKAMDIHTISEYPDEEEVLLFPGIPFEIRKIDMNTTMNMVEIELVPMLSNFGNVQKMFSDILD